MDDLVERLTTGAGITPDQAEKVIQTLKDYIVEKFPMMGNAVDSLLAARDKDDNDPLA